MQAWKAGETVWQGQKAGPEHSAGEVIPYKFGNPVRNGNRDDVDVFEDRGICDYSLVAPVYC